MEQLKERTLHLASDEMITDSSVCQKCGKPQTKAGSMTQWIFDPNNCSCTASSSSGDMKKPELSLCPLCGLPTKKKSQGSITQWIFRSKNCSCLTAIENDSNLSDLTVPNDDSISGSPYQFVSVAGHGGIGTVYKALSRKLGRPVAVKVLQAHEDDLRASQVFMREAKAASKVQHPNILTILDFGTMQNGSLYMVAEWLDGITLAQYLTRHGRMPVETAVEIACQVLDGLSHAHKNNVVHRDIKPSNIMLERTASGGWTIKIIDFGTAKEIDQEGALTRAENIACSPYYMSPEQATGLLIDQTSDLYSLGCTLFEALTGKPPFTGPAMSVVMRHQTEPAPTLSSAAGGVEFPAYLEQIVAKLLEKSPTDRFQTAVEAKDALLQQTEISETKTKSRKAFRAKPLVLAGSIMLLGIAGITISTLLSQPKNAEPPKVSLGPEREISSLMPQLEELEPGDGIAKFHEHGNARGLKHLKFSQFSNFDCGKIRTIDFRYSGLTDKTTYLIKDCVNLDHLDLTETAITDKGIELMPALEHLSSIRLKSTAITDDGLAQIIRKFPNLNSIDVCDTAITNRGVVHFSKLPKLEILSLALTKVTDDGVEALANSSPHVSSLNLSGLPITDKSLNLIVTLMTNMQHLLLAQTKVTDEGLKKLTSLKVLHRVFLSDNGHITQPVIDNLHRTLPQCSIVVTGMGKSRLASRINDSDFKDDGVSVLVNLEKNRNEHKDEESNFSDNSLGSK